MHYLGSAEQESAVLKAQVQSSKEQLEQKGAELSMALTSLGDIQKTNMERETKLRADAQAYTYAHTTCLRVRTRVRTPHNSLSTPNISPRRSLPRPP